MVSLSSYINDQLDRLTEIDINDKQNIGKLNLEVNRSKAVSLLAQAGVSVAKVHISAAKYIDETKGSLDDNSRPSNEIMEILGFET